MSIDPRAGSPFPGLSFAGELDEVQNQALEVTMTEKWVAYLNQRTLNEFLTVQTGRLSHLRFIPDPEQGMVIMVPTTNSSDYGATALEYTETENGATINVRLAAKRCNVKPQKHRIHVFPVVRRPAPDGKVYLAFVVKDATTRPAKVRSKVAQVAAGQQQG